MLKSRILLFVLSAASAACLSACRDQGVGRWVDPNIGGVAPLLTTVTPQVHRPHSMVRVFPVTEPGLNDRYFSDRIYGIALNMPRYRSGVVGSVMPAAGEVSFAPERSSSWYDHDLEELHPWSHRVWLEEPAVWAEWTTMERAALYEFDFTDAGRQANVLFRVGSEGEVAVDGNRVVSGWESVDYARQYFYAVADRPFVSSGTYDGTALSGECSASGSGIGAWLSAPAGFGKVCFRVGISYIDVEQARANLEAETGGLAFDAVKERSRAVWEEALGRIRVKGGTDRERRIFYTSLYRTFERMVDQSEGGRYYSGFDRRVHEDARPFYNDDWMWDTYRNLHQLMTLVYPERQLEMVRSMIGMYKEWGWLPKWELYGRETFTMEGDPAIPVIVDTWMKGLRDFDMDAAYEAMRKSATTPGAQNRMRPDIDPYVEKGYVPLGFYARDLSGDNSVSHALEYYIADHALSLLADSLGRREDAALFRNRSLGYKNYYSPESGTFRPITGEGGFLTPFDPRQGENFEPVPGFHEGSAWNYTFYVPHDVYGLSKLMGGRRKFIDKLQMVFDEGLYDPANEPDIAYPYLFSYFRGEEWRTQREVNRLLAEHFTTAPDGIPGNDDTGTMSAWAVFSMMGFYPDCPGEPYYTLTSPVFDRVTVMLDRKYYPAGELVIETKRPDSGAVYIRSMTLGGKPLKRYRIGHDELLRGGRLTFELQNRK